VRRLGPPIYSQLMCLCAILFFLNTSYGQSSSGRGNSQQDMQNREWALGHIGEEVNSHFARENNFSQPNLREDFRKLQIENNGLMKRVFVQNSSNPKEIKCGLIEIRKLARHLRTALAFPDSPRTSEKPAKEGNNLAASADTPELLPGLLLLDHAVTSFVKNPMFQQLRVVDSTLALQAGKDLNEILRLTDLLSRKNMPGAN
jgi:hypothetical protein